MTNLVATSSEEKLLTFDIWLCILNTKSSTSLKTMHMYVCLRKGTIRNILIQIHANLLKNYFINIVHSKYNTCTFRDNLASILNSIIILNASIL